MGIAEIILFFTSPVHFPGNWRMELSVKPSTSSSMIVLSNDCTNEKPEAVQEDPENKKNRRPSMTLSLDSNLVLTLRFSDDKVEDLQCQVTAVSAQFLSGYCNQGSAPQVTVARAQLLPRLL